MSLCGLLGIVEGHQALVLQTYVYIDLPKAGKYKIKVAHCLGERFDKCGVSFDKKKHFFKPNLHLKELVAELIFQELLPKVKEFVLPQFSYYDTWKKSSIF